MGKQNVKVRKRRFSHADSLKLIERYGFDFDCEQKENKYKNSEEGIITQETATVIHSDLQKDKGCSHDPDSHKQLTMSESCWATKIHLQKKTDICVC